MNILYILTPHSVHDQKWVSFFSNRKDIKQFAIWETTYNSHVNESHIAFFKSNGIAILPSYPSFSFLNFFKTLKTISKLNQQIKLNNIDFVHILFTTPHALYVPFLKRKFILTTRGSDILSVIPNLRKSRGFKFLYDLVLFYFFKYSFTRAALITCTSQLQIEKIKKLFGIVNNIHLVRTGVDVEGICNLRTSDNLPASLKGKKFIFSPRYLHPKYNVEIQIAAIQLLSKKTLNQYLFVFIKYEADPYYAMMINELDNVAGLQYMVFENLSQQEMWACFKQASLAFMIPHSDGTPNTALEAMAAGCKLIVGNATYDNILFNDTCIVVDKTDPKQLADAIESTLEYYPQDLIKNAFAKVSQYGNRAIEMNKLLNLYYGI